MDKNSALKGKIMKGKRTKERLLDDSDDETGLGDAKKSLNKVKKLVGDDDEKPKKKKKSKKAPVPDDDDEPDADEGVKTATKKAQKPTSSVQPLKTLDISGKLESLKSMKSTA